MVDLHSILTEHRSKEQAPTPEQVKAEVEKSREIYLEIPELFFTEIIVKYKLNRIDILVLIYIYKYVWCYSNINKAHGISPLLSHTEMSQILSLTTEEIYSSLRKLEEFDFIKTIRSGQYFVRKYFSKEMDELKHMRYDDFEF